MRWYRVSTCPLCPEDADAGGYVTIEHDYRGHGYVDAFKCDEGLHSDLELTDAQREDLYHEAIEAAEDREF